MTIHSQGIDDETKSTCIHHERMFVMVEEIHTCLLGDFKERGLLSRVKELEDWQNAKKKTDSTIAKAILGYASTSIIAIGAFIWAVITHTVQIVKH